MCGCGRKHLLASCVLSHMGCLLEVPTESDAYLEYLVSDSSHVLNDRYRQLCFGIHLSNEDKVKMAAS